MENKNLKTRMYGIGMGEGYVYVSIVNLLIYFMIGSTEIIGANVIIALVGVGLYLYSRYIMKVENESN